MVLESGVIRLANQAAPRDLGPESRQRRRLASPSRALEHILPGEPATSTSPASASSGAVALSIRRIDGGSLLVRLTTVGGDRAEKMRVDRRQRSHELRTPLATIWLSETLAMKPNWNRRLG